jgi:hypothetical protein
MLADAEQADSPRLLIHMRMLNSFAFWTDFNHKTKS